MAREEARRARVSAVHEAIAQLPPGQRVVVERHKLQGVPMHAVADQLGMKSGAIRVRAHRAYQPLRVQLERMMFSGTISPP